MIAAAFKAWISAARLRTLPLSISGILVGSAYGYFHAQQRNLNKVNFEKTINSNINCDIFYFNELHFNFLIPVLALITTLGFQVLSNFANDYGDGVKGTDNDERVGPMRALQSGLIKPYQMKRAIIITAIISLISAILLIYTSLGMDAIFVSLVFLALGIGAVWAAIKYTVGDNAYGYRGLGDVFVFVFFGPVSVLGVSYLITKNLEWKLILPAITVGLLSVAVLNLNNMRDMESDANAGKNTIVVKLGLMVAKRLHYVFLSVACACALAMAFLLKTLYGFIPLVAFVPIALHALKVYNNKIPALLDPELKKVALSTFLYALCTIIAVVLIVN